MLFYDNVFETEGYFFNYETGEYEAEVYSELLYIVTNIYGTNGEPVQDANVTWMINLGTFGGVIAGAIAASLYNKYSDINLPQSLSFFSGRRFVPVLVLSSMIVIAFLIAIIWPWIQYSLFLFMKEMSDIQVVSAMIYTFLANGLFAFGLHHVLNLFVFWQIPMLYEGSQVFILDSSGTDFIPLLGDIPAFLAGTSSTVLQVDGVVYNESEDVYNILYKAGAGIYQTVYFNTSTFIAFALVTAMILTADKENKKGVQRMLIPSTVILVLTGIGEPLFFSFLFVAPLLFVVYALVATLSSAIFVLAGIRIGFSFSSSIFDFVLSAPISSNLSQGIFSGYMFILGFLLIGIAFFIVFTPISYLTIIYGKCPTPGRLGNNTYINVESSNKTEANKKNTSAEEIIEIVGKDNIISVTNCMTRIRIKVKNNTKLNREYFVKLGYIDLVKIGKNEIQIISRTNPELVTTKINNLLNKN